jgi:hypothetical protein
MIKLWRRRFVELRVTRPCALGEELGRGYTKEFGSGERASAGEKTGRDGCGQVRSNMKAVQRVLVF